MYAAAAGDVLLDVGRTGTPGPEADPAVARAAYRERTASATLDRASSSGWPWPSDC
ncbi:MAG TPA: hypothetical protein VOB72_24815 [Candidatus Dormibacteraeota bacterium]|nr:hypothetical protein [Candidatus Dormibacteraeota bacterium]